MFILAGIDLIIEATVIHTAAGLTLGAIVIHTDAELILEDKLLTDTDLSTVLRAPILSRGA